jgi:hypothetical protein
VAVYLIDVGVENPRDFALGTVRLSEEVITEKSPLSLETEISCLGPSGRRTVELILLGETADGEPAGETGQGVRRNQKVFEIADDGAQAIRLELGVLERGTHQGVVRILEQDNLTSNNERYFSFEVKPPWKILVVRSPQAETYLVEALAPEEYRKSGVRRGVSSGPAAVGPGRVAEAGRLRGHRRRRGNLPGTPGGHESLQSAGSPGSPTR